MTLRKVCEIKLRLRPVSIFKSFSDRFVWIKFNMENVFDYFSRAVCSQCVVQCIIQKVAYQNYIKIYISSKFSKKKLFPLLKSSKPCIGVLVHRAGERNLNRQ